MNAIRTNFQIDRERKNGNDLSEQSYVMATGKLKNKSVNQHSIETWKKVGNERQTTIVGMETVDKMEK